MYRLYGDDIQALRLYGLGTRGGLGALSGTSDEVNRNLKAFFASSDYRAAAAAAWSAEVALGRRVSFQWKALIEWGGIFKSDDYKRELKAGQAYLARLAAERDEPGEPAGLGQVAIVAALSTGVKVYGALKGRGAGRKARQKARTAARGAKFAQEYLVTMVYRYAETLLELSRLGIDPPDAAPNAEWLADWEKRIATGAGGKVKKEGTTMLPGMIAFFRAAAQELKNVTQMPEPAQPIPLVTASGVSPAAPAAVPSGAAAPPLPAAQTAPAAAGGGGAAKLGLALLAAKLLLGA